MRRTCPTSPDFPPLLARYLEIFAGQHSAVDQVTAVAELAVAVQRLAVAVLVAVVDCFAAATLAHYKCLVWRNSFVGSKAFEADCSFLHFVTCTNYWADFWKNENFFK